MFQWHPVSVRQTFIYICYAIMALCFFGMIIVTVLWIDLAIRSLGVSSDLYCNGTWYGSTCQVGGR